MNSYLLLRNNKESGPYSLKDLLDFGLKAYDLVWVQGKSAAWRYPSEIEELKEFSPAVEEQPFDRFFKKPSDKKKEDVSVNQKETVNSAKSVFDSLPRQKAPITETESEIPVSKTIVVMENPAAVEAKYAEPIDEMKEMYAKKFQQRKRKIARRNLLFQTFKRASVFLYMIALGILIGFTLKSKMERKSVVSVPQSNKSQTVKVDTVQIVSKQEESKSIQAETREEIKPKVENIQKPVGEKTETPVLKKEQPVLTKPDININQTSPGLETNEITGERNKKSRTEEQATKPAIKADLSKSVSVTGNNYKRGAFGGIRDLQLTVTNDSKYILDNVTVELQYLKPSEEPLKTENIQFHSISPNGSLTIAIPPSNRGIKVLYKITKIESKELNDETAGL